MDGYTLVQAWMLSDPPGLRGSRLLLFAAVHGFCRDGRSCYRGGLRFLAEAAGVSERHARRLVAGLVADGLLERGGAASGRGAAMELRTVPSSFAAEGGLSERSKNADILSALKNRTSCPEMRTSCPENRTSCPQPPAPPLLVENTRKYIKEKKIRENEGLSEDGGLSERQKAAVTRELLLRGCLRPDEEAADFEAYNRARGWTVSGAPVRDPAALARVWTPRHGVKEGQGEFLALWGALLAEAEAEGCSDPRLLDPRIRADCTGSSVRVSCPAGVREWLERHVEMRDGIYRLLKQFVSKRKLTYVDIGVSKK